VCVCVCVRSTPCPPYVTMRTYPARSFHASMSSLRDGIFCLPPALCAVWLHYVVLQLACEALLDVLFPIPCPSQSVVPPCVLRSSCYPRTELRPAGARGAEIFRNRSGRPASGRRAPRPRPEPGRPRLPAAARLCRSAARVALVRTGPPAQICKGLASTRQT
jgi:hypothetical protein